MGLFPFSLQQYHLLPFFFHNLSKEEGRVFYPFILLLLSIFALCVSSYLSPYVRRRRPRLRTVPPLPTILTGKIPGWRRVPEYLALLEKPALPFHFLAIALPPRSGRPYKGLRPCPRVWSPGPFMEFPPLFESFCLSYRWGFIFLSFHFLPFYYLVSPPRKSEDSW